MIYLFNRINSEWKNKNKNPLLKRVPISDAENKENAKRSQSDLNGTSKDKRNQRNI